MIFQGIGEEVFSLIIRTIFDVLGEKEKKEVDKRGSILEKCSGCLFDPRMKIKKGDNVVVTRGKDRGKKGTVVRALPEKDRIVVEGVALCTKHQKEQGGKAGGRIQFEQSIHVSNVKIICPESKESTRVVYQRGKDGKKYRVAKCSGVTIDTPFVKS